MNLVGTSRFQGILRKGGIHSVVLWYVRPKPITRLVDPILTNYVTGGNSTVILCTVRFDNLYYLVPGIPVLGTRYQVPGTRYGYSTAWLQVPGTWYQVVRRSLCESVRIPGPVVDIRTDTSLCSNQPKFLSPAAAQIHKLEPSIFLAAAWLVNSWALLLFVVWLINTHRYARCIAASSVDLILEKNVHLHAFYYPSVKHWNESFLVYCKASDYCWEP